MERNRGGNKNAPHFKRGNFMGAVREREERKFAALDGLNFVKRLPFRRGAGSQL